jgi:hypothetical protein
MAIVSNPTYEGYTENHHIIPRCIGGEETVSLSARQHFVCHWLLTKMTKGELRCKMIFAFSKMCFQDNNGNRYINSHGYRECREKLMPEIGRIIGLTNKGKKYCHKNGKTKLVHLDEYKRLLKEGWKAGRTEEFNKKHAEINKGRKFCHKNGKHKSVPLDEYKRLLKEGWKAGISEELIEKYKGKKWCHKNGKQKSVPLDEYKRLLKEGWKAGMVKRVKTQNK